MKPKGLIRCVVTVLFFLTKHKAGFLMTQLEVTKMLLATFWRPLKPLHNQNQSWHYANMSVQYSAIFHGCENDNFHVKIFDIFLFFAQNIDCGYTLEPPQ